ncbi:MAG: ComEC/Rec2 family competence protein [Jiangellaceae bacterium]
MTGAVGTNDPSGAAGADDGGGLDLRLVPAAAATWAGVLVGTAASAPVLVAVTATVMATAAGALALTGPAVTRHARLAVLVALACLVGGVVAGGARAASLRAGPVDDLAADGAMVSMTGTLVTDPQRRTTHIGPRNSSYVVARLRVETVTGRGTSTRVRTAVLLIATNESWVDLRPGQRVSIRGRLAPAEESGNVAAIMRVRDPPGEAGRPGPTSRLTEPLRAGLRDAVSGLTAGPRGLVPALVVGDESLMDVAVQEDMQTAGLTHLTAVSGTNVTIVLVAVLGVARWAGLRSYGLPALGGLAVVGFVLLARPEPSVIRAAAMGLVALVGLTVAGRRRGLPALATAVVVLLLVDPWLGRSPGFALSVLATGGILLLAPAWRDAMPWLPRPVAEALAVPLAAQVACAPVVVAVAGQASLVSVPANILVAPAIAPATVLGAAAAVVSPLSETIAAGLGWLAGLPATWIVLVARRGAELPGAVMVWPDGAVGVLVAAALSLGAVVVLPTMLRRPLLSGGTSVVLLLALVRAPTPGWPPPEWLLVACDVGQGDALVLNAGADAAVVVDTGPDPRPVHRCLDSLGVEQVPLLVLTHYHADHVEGLAGVLDGRRVDRVLVSPLADPDEQADLVRGWLDDAGVPVAVAQVGDDFAVGDSVRLRVLWPRRIITDGSAANNASVVLDVVAGGARILLTGDIEPEAQRALVRHEPRLEADVLKVPHHTLRYGRMSDKPFRAAIYARISDDREADELGVQRQLKAGRELVEQRGGTIVLERDDNDMTALTGQRRPGYDDVMAAAAAGDITHIVVFHTSRWWRNRRERAEGIEALRQAGVSVAAVKGPDLDMSSAYGRGMAGMLGEFDTMESEVKSERIKLKVAELVDAGKIGNGGPRPYGFRRIYVGEGPRRKIVRDEVEPAEAAIVAEMAARLLAGESLRSLVGDLNDRGEPTSTGRLWTMQALRLLLRSGRIAGLREHHGVVRGPAVWPAIVDRETHEQLRAKLDSRQRPPGARVRTHYLTGFVFCSDCAKRGVAMKVSRHHGKLKYRCPPRQEGGCNGRVIVLADLQNMVDLYMVGKLSGPDTLRELAERDADRDDQSAEMVAAIEVDGRRLTRLQAELVDGAVDEVPEIAASVRTIRRRIAETRERLAQASQTPEVTRLDLPDLARRWRSLHIDQKRTLLGLFVDRIAIGPARRGLAKFDPGRVRIEERQP